MAADDVDELGRLAHARLDALTREIGALRFAQQSDASSADARLALLVGVVLGLWLAVLVRAGRARLIADVDKTTDTP